MNLALIYSKTGKGVAEVAQRSGTVPLPARRILIMIDGSRAAAELVPVVRDGELAACLELLETGGMIEKSGQLELQTQLEDEALALAEAALEAATMPAPWLSSPLPAQPTAAAIVERSADSKPRPPTLTGMPSPGQRSAATVSPSVSRPSTLSGAIAANTPATGGSAPQSPQSLDEIKRVALRELFARLGPYGETTAAGIQGCTTLATLRHQILEAGRRIEKFRGDKAAQEYLLATGSP